MTDRKSGEERWGERGKEQKTDRDSWRDRETDRDSWRERGRMNERMNE